MIKEFCALVESSIGFISIDKWILLLVKVIQNKRLNFHTILVFDDQDILNILSRLIFLNIFFSSTIHFWHNFHDILTQYFLFHKLCYVRIIIQNINPILFPYEITTALCHWLVETRCSLIEGDTITSYNTAINITYAELAHFIDFISNTNYPFLDKNHFIMLI